MKHIQLSDTLYTIIGIIFIIPPLIAWMLLILELFHIGPGSALQYVFGYVPEFLLIMVWIVLPASVICHKTYRYLIRKTRK